MSEQRRDTGERIRPPSTPEERALETALRAAYEADGWTDTALVEHMLDAAQIFRERCKRATPRPA